MSPMRNRHTNINCRGLHKLKKEAAAVKFEAVFKKGLWSLEKVKEK